MTFLKINISDDDDNNPKPCEAFIHKSEIRYITKVAPPTGIETNLPYAVRIALEGSGFIFEYKYQHDMDNLYKLLCDAFISEENVTYVEFLHDNEK